MEDHKTFLEQFPEEVQLLNMLHLQAHQCGPMDFGLPLENLQFKRAAIELLLAYKSNLKL